MGVGADKLPHPVAAPLVGLRSLLRALADIVLPPVCASPAARASAAIGFCAAPAGRVDFIAPPLCDRLGIPLSYDPGTAPGERALSAAAIAAPPVYDRARAAARYDATMRDLIQSFKYRDRHEGLPLFARWLASAGTELLADADLIVPVPLYRMRLWSRRFNQSALLARALGRITGQEVDCFTLKRVKRTANQVGLSAARRRRNVAGAFKVSRLRKARIKGRKIVLIDDVITTGATAEVCARVLKRAGALRVDVLAIARAADPNATVL